MVWRSIGEALESALIDRLNEAGERAVDAAPLAQTAKKAPRAMKPEASVTGQRQTKGEVVDYANAGEGSRAPSIMDRCMTTARRTTGLPTRSAVVIHLDMYRQHRHATSP